MSKISNFPKLLALVILCVAYINCAQAQQAATKTKQPAKQLNYQIVNISDAGSNIDGKESKDLVYYRYKGIANIEEAKVAWIKDNPETYRKMNEQGGRPASPKTGSNQTTGNK